MGAETRELGAKIIDFAQNDPLFARLRAEAEDVLRREPELGGFLHPAILSQNGVLGVVAHRVAQRLDRPEAPYIAIRQAFEECAAREPGLGRGVPRRPARRA